MASTFQPGEGPQGSKEDRNAQAARLLEAYGDSLFRYAYTYLHNKSDAEDIVQDTLVQFLKTQPDLSSPAQEKAWLFRVAGNLSKNKIKYNRIRIHDELEESLVGEEESDLAFIWDAVRDLPDKYREVIHLFYYEGYSTREIAAILDRRESTVRSDLHRGREQLKKKLKGAFDFE